MNAVNAATIRVAATWMLVTVAACADAGRPAEVRAPADSAAGEVALRLAGAGGAALVVEARVNGRGPIHLILDTGATLTCLDSALVRELGLPARRGVLGAAVGVGGAGQVDLVEVDSLRIGQATALDLMACSLDLQRLRMIDPDVRGLLGLNFLRNFDVGLDFDREVLRLTRP